MRLAYCVAEAAEELEASEAATLERSCELGVGPGSRIVAYPPRAVRSDELRALGLTDDHLRALGELEYDDDRWLEQIRVLPPGRRPRASRTGYHSRFVHTPEPLVCQLGASAASITLRKESGAIVWVALEPAK